MNQQPQLPGFFEPLPCTERLILGIFPPRDVVEQMAAIASGLRTKYRLTGALRPLSHFHITLRWLGDYAALEEARIQRIRQTCEASVRSTSAFDIKFHKILHFKGNGTISLAGDENDNASLMKFQKELLGELTKSRCEGPKKQSFDPHLTMLYDPRTLSEELPEPIVWRATGIALVHSEISKTKHHHLGQWKLG